MLCTRALLVLLIYDILNAACGFKTIHSIVKHWKVASTRADERAIGSVCRAVNYACILYPKHVLCLQRAFVTTYLLRKRGVPVQLVLGAQQLPFAAHAWVEVDGQAVNERSNVQGLYAIWDRC